MARSHIITALDIGSGSIKILSVLKKPGKTDFEVLGQGQEPSFGIRRGVVVDVLKVGEIISSLKKQVEQSCGKNINDVYAGIGGSHIFCTSSQGLVSVSRADQKISEEDIDRVLQAAQTFSLPSNKEIIDVFPKEFIVDGEGGVKEVTGMQGVRLEAAVLVLCGFSPYLRNSSQTILKSGFQINDLIPTPLASSRAVMTPREKELGVCVLDIGARTTGLAVFEEGNLIHTAIFPVGSGHITDDIATCFKTDIDTAERIKLEFGSCSRFSQKPKKTERKIKIEPLRKDIDIEAEEEPLIFSPKRLTEIIEARVSDIFDLTDKELKKISRQGLLPAGVVLTGGGARMPRIIGLAKKELNLPCRIGIPKEIPTLQEDPALSTLYGLILKANDLEEEEEGTGLVTGIKDKFKKILKIFIP